MYDSRFSVAQAAERLHRKSKTRDRIRAERRARAQSWARDVAYILGNADESLEKVIGFGSTFETWRTFREDSDIDLGIIGGNWSFLMRSIPASAIEQLRAELKQDMDIIAVNHRKNREMTRRIEESQTDDEFQFAALGYTIHNLYNAFESYFLRIAKFFENNLVEHEWHRSLIHRMTLDINGVRPALFDMDLANRIDELMRFRHLFRNLYKTPLIPDRVLFANSYAATLREDFERCHTRFDEFLVELKRETER